MKSRLVTIDCDGELQTNLPPAIGTYSTLCGMDGDDPAIGLITRETIQGSKVDCEACQAIWGMARTFKSSAFKEVLK